MKPTATHPRSKDILRALMDPSRPDIVPWSSSELRAVLEHQLATPLTAEADLFCELAQATPAEIAAVIGESSCRTFRDLLWQAAPPLPLLRLAKDYAKASLAGDGGLPRDVARVLYVLTILSAPGARRAQVTSLGDGNVEREVRRCLTFGWLPDDVRDLIRARLGRRDA